MQEALNQSIEDLKVIKAAVNELKREYLEIPDTDEEFKGDVNKIIILLDKIYEEIFDKDYEISKFKYYGKFYIPTISKIVRTHVKFLKNPSPSAKVIAMDDNSKATIKKLIEHFEKKYNSYFEKESINLNADIQLLLGSLK